MIGRRKFLLKGTEAGPPAMIGAGGVAFFLADPFGSWIRATLERSLPGALEPNELSTFIEASHAGSQSNRELRTFVSAGHRVDARPALLDETSGYVEEEGREILTGFLIVSHFFGRTAKSHHTVQPSRNLRRSLCNFLGGLQMRARKRLPPRWLAGLGRA